MTAIGGRARRTHEVNPHKSNNDDDDDDDDDVVCREINTVE